MPPARARRVSHRSRQLTLPDTGAETPLRSWQAASSVVGEFFELLTAHIFDGWRRAASDDAGDNPDVVAANGLVFESKAAGRDRWLLQAAQHRRFAKNPDGRYALWEYAKPAQPLVDLAGGTVEGLRRWLGANVTACYVMPATFPDRILAGTPHEKPRGTNRLWGENYWFRGKYLREVLAGRRWLGRDYVQQRRTLRLRAVRGVAVLPFPLVWLAPLPDLTEDDRLLAAIALRELETRRLEVALIPADSHHPLTRPGQKIYAVQNTNPDWYRAFLDRRRKKPRRNGPKKKPESPGRRAHVRRALERLAEGNPHPRKDWIGWELLELLREHFETDR